MNVFLIILRIVHIVAGVAWVGGAAIHTVFIAPAAKATAPESHKFIEYFMGRRHFSLFMNVSSALTVIAGALLFWRSSGGLQWPWITSGPGVMFSVGAVVGLTVYLWGFLMIRPRVIRLGVLGKAIGANGGVPAPEQVAELRKLDDELTLIGRVDFALLTVALLAMAMARYTWF